ncbi:MAG: hypothetical protein KAW01_05210, partial [Deltaproteobacteria bacterium]|nr:hypothetical protein [Deltaproteobacteria bacterium]
TRFVIDSHPFFSAHLLISVQPEGTQIQAERIMYEQQDHDDGRLFSSSRDNEDNFIAPIMALLDFIL